MTESLRIFLVEDDAFLGTALQYHLQLNPDYEVLLFPTAKACLDQLHHQPDVVCLDFGLPDMAGDVLMSKIHQKYPQLPVLIMSAQEDIEVAVNFLKNGAKDYIVKGAYTKELLWKALLNVREHIQLVHQVEHLQDQLADKFSFDKNIIGQSTPMQEVFGLMRKAAQSQINVSITGQTGTGKEVVAQAIHFHSERKNKPFVAVNMAAIPTELMESEFFGHEAGAFTGAQGRKAGKFEQAHGGTLFLDEIAELDLGLQSKLLRVLQEREVTRVGGSERIKINVRLISATHKDLTEEVRQGRFREDLFYRIMGLPIHLPPLTERHHDVLLLAKHFIKQYAHDNKCKPLGLRADAQDKLLHYPFPGNIRELKSAIDLACVLCDHPEIGADDLRLQALQPTSVALSGQKTLKAYTEDIILTTLRNNHNDVLKTAKQLDIGKSTIYNLLKGLHK